MRACLVALTLLVGCGAEPSVPSSGPPEPSAVAPLVPPAAPPVPAAVADPCEVHRASFRAAIASATGTCTADAECGCFNPVVGEAGCGGITDAVTAARMAAIEAAFHAADCPWPHACGPWSCTPVCREGRCVNGDAGGLITPPL